jgi:DeoR family transcriptional regulator, aga operon transcriptional repressor
MPTTSQPRHTEQRRASIVALVQRQQQVSVTALSRQFGISQVSIRRDLDYLAEAGLLRRTHGGAEALGGAAQGGVFDLRLQQNVAIKRAIGQAAAALVKPGEVILLDSGTTVLEIARHLPRSLLENGNLTVITRSLAIANELRSQRQVRLIVLGGVYLPEYDDFAGEQVEAALQSLHANLLFIGAEGIALERGLTTDNLLEMSVYRALAKSADKVVVVADSSKIGVSKLQTLLPFEAVQVFITDAGAPAGLAQRLQDKGIQVILAPVS